MSQLFSPLFIKDIQFKNRVGVAPMCQYASIDGLAQPWHMAQNAARAVGGAGLNIVEATAVVPEGRITPACAGIWNDEQVAALKPINAFMKSMGCVPGIQLAHAGRKASAAVPWEGGASLGDEQGGFETFCAGDKAFDDDGVRLWRKPTQLSIEQIQTVQQAYVDATKRSLEAGYEFLEIHAAHGYLAHSFFTPLVNERSDAYGGSLKNSARFLLETTEKVRAVWPDRLPLAVRISTCDWDEAGLSLDDNVQLAIWLKERGVDLIDCSSGGATPTARSSISGNTHKQVSHAAYIREHAEVMTMAVGEITDPHQAETILKDGQADFALLGRELIRNPYWPLQAAKALGVETKPQVPPQLSFFVG